MKVVKTYGFKNSKESNYITGISKFIIKTRMRVIAFVRLLSTGDTIRIKPNRAEYADTHLGAARAHDIDNLNHPQSEHRYYIANLINAH